MTMMLEENNLSPEPAAYIHIPFCEHICYYCDFNKVFLRGQPVDEYIEQLLKEITLTIQQNQGMKTVRSLYIGGGTPTALTAQQLDTLLTGICTRLSLKSGGEFTIEANPGDLTAEKLAIFQQHGVNRLSLGVQTFDDRLLKKIGRKHTAQDSRMTVELVKKFGFDNISIDLIYALPDQSLESYTDTLNQALLLDLPHYSLYSLIVENQTIFANWARKGKLPLPSQEIEAQMFEWTTEKLLLAGLQQYEISNFAKPGRESQHNLVYWNNESYYGFGAGASGYIGQVRYRNHGPIQHYLQPLREGKLPIIEQEKLLLEHQMEEELFLGLRKTQGVSKVHFTQKFGCSFESVYQSVTDELITKGLLEEEGEFIFLSNRGRQIGNEVFQAFLLS